MKQEVRRGRKFVEYHDPETQDEFTFTQEISVADVSYQETDGSWHPANENWATDGVDGFILKNDKLNHKVRLKGTGGRTWYPRRNVNTEYMTFGVPQYRNGNKWSNFRFSGWSVDGKTITLNTRQGVTILVHNRWNGIKIDWVLASSTAPSRMRYPVALTGITEIADVLFGADGVELGRLTPTTATDVNGAELPCSGSYANGYVEFQADVTGAVYPVTIDPDFSTGASDDTTLRSGYDTRSYGSSGVFSYNPNLIRFDCSSIPSTATATAAAVKLYKAEAQGATTTCTVSFYSIASGNSDWVGGTSMATETSGSSTWGYKRCYNNAETNVAWAGSAGLGTSGTDYEATLLGSYSGDRADPVGQEYVATFNSSGITRVQGWFGATNTNYGLVFFVDFTVADPYMMEATTESYRPVLTVTYTAGGALRRINTSSFQQLTGGIHG